MSIKRISLTPDLVTKVAKKVLVNPHGNQSHVSKPSSVHTSTTTLESTDGSKESIQDTQKSVSSDVQSDKYETYLNSIKLKDSGYSWVVVSAMLISNILTAGYVKSFGIVYNSVLDEYPDTYGAEAGLMISFLIGSRALLTPAAGALIVKYGSRFSMTLGTMFCFLGFVSSFFCKAVWQFSITLGATTGIGICLIESTQVVVLPKYFEKNLSIASGIRSSGFSIGGILFPFILLLLTNNFGFRVSHFLLGAVFLHILICMVLIRTPKTHKKIQILKMLQELNTEKSDKRQIYEEISNRISHSCQQSKRKAFEFHFLKNAVYWVFILSSISSTFALPIISQYVSIYTKSAGLSPDQISFLMSFQSVVEMISCITIGYLNNRNICKRLYSFVFGLCIGSIGIIFFPFCKDLWQFYLASTFLTFGGSSRLVLYSVILTEQFGKASISTTYGFARMIQGIFQFLVPLLLGSITDVSKSYIPTFIVMAGGMLVSAFLLLLEPVVIKLTKSKIVIT